MDAQWLLLVVPCRDGRPASAAYVAVWSRFVPVKAGRRGAAAAAWTLSFIMSSMSSLHSAEATLMYLYEGGQLSAPSYTAQGTAKLQHTGPPLTPRPPQSATE